MEEICYGPKVAHQYRFVKFAQGTLHFHMSLVRATITQKQKEKKKKKSHTPYSLSLIAAVPVHWFLYARIEEVQ